MENLSLLLDVAVVLGYIAVIIIIVRRWKR